MRPDLNRANLRAAYLPGADFSGADLSGADLSGADLGGADLSGANLTYTSLVGAKIFDADLKEANLTGAKLSGANFTGAKLNGALLCAVEVDNFSISTISTEAQEHHGKTWTIHGLGRPLGPQKPHILRSIEFPPEYKATGTSILTYFGEVLEAKYEDLEVKVTISQEKNTVSMLIETEDGEELEKIEKTLEEYGLVVVGKMLPEKLLEAPAAVLKLKHEMRLIETRLKTQKEIMVYQKADITELRGLLAKALEPAPPPQVSVTVDSSSTATATQIFTLNLNAARSAVQELAEELPEGDDRAVVEEVAKALEQVDKNSKPEDAAGKSWPSKLRRLVQDLGDDKSSLGKTVKGLKAGSKIAQDLGRRYNAIAEWCGMPVVPAVLVGSKKEKA